MTASNPNESLADRVKRMLEGVKKTLLPVKIIGEHTVKEGETLTHITLKFYGEVDKPFWQYLYDYNKDVIGPNMRLMQSGMVLKIPELTPELKQKKKNK